jgi:Flp pilus assembly protein protease CpaA
MSFKIKPFVATVVGTIVVEAIIKYHSAALATLALFLLYALLIAGIATLVMLVFRPEQLKVFVGRTIERAKDLRRFIDQKLSTELEEGDQSNSN